MCNICHLNAFGWQNVSRFLRGKQCCCDGPAGIAFLRMHTYRVYSMSPGWPAVMQLISPRYRGSYEPWIRWPRSKQMENCKLQILRPKRTAALLLPSHTFHFLPFLPSDSWLQFPGQHSNSKKNVQALISVRRIYKQLYANKEKQATRVSHNNSHTATGGVNRTKTGRNRTKGARAKGLAKWVKKRGLPVDYCNKRNSANISSQSAVKRTQGGCAIFLCAPARIHRKAISI